MSNTKFLFSIIKIILLKLLQYTYIALVLLNFIINGYFLDLYNRHYVLELE
jgi:hypothetical protein